MAMSKVSAEVDKLAEKKVAGKRSLSALELIFFIIAILVAWQGHRIGLGTPKRKFIAVFVILFVGMVLG